MAPGQNHRIVLSDNANGEVAADAVQVTRVGAPPPTATWLPSLPRTDTYQVYERTPGSGTWTSTAPFTVFHQAGSTTTLESEVTGGGTWKLLGTYDLYPGQNHRVELTDVVSTGSYVVADAVKFVPVASAKWRPMPSTSPARRRPRIRSPGRRPSRARAPTRSTPAGRPAPATPAPRNTR